MQSTCQDGMCCRFWAGSSWYWLLSQHWLSSLFWLCCWPGVKGLATPSSHPSSFSSHASLLVCCLLCITHISRLYIRDLGDLIVSQSCQVWSITWQMSNYRICIIAAWRYPEVYISEHMLQMPLYSFILWLRFYLMCREVIWLHVTQTWSIIFLLILLRMFQIQVCFYERGLYFLINRAGPDDGMFDFSDLQGCLL